MKKQLLIPQILFSGVIKKAKSIKNKDSNWEIPLDTLLEQVKKLSPILSRLKQKDRAIFTWFLVDDSIDKRGMLKIERQLEALIEEYIDDWEVEAVLIPTSEHATYEDIRLEVDILIHKLFKRFPFEHFTQIVGFGDVVPFQAIFLEGLQQFGDRYASLYYENNELHITHTKSEPNIRNWKREFRVFIMDHDYQTALELLRDVEQTKEVLGVKYLLQMMIDRFNFAFEDAFKHLLQAREMISHPLLEETSDKLSLLLSQDNKTRDINRIVELYRQLDVYIDIDDTTSFLIRFYRAREAILYYLLHHAQVVPSPVQSKKKSTIYQVVDELEQKYDNWEIDGMYGAYFYLKSQNVAQTLNVRNKSFIGHSRKGIDKKQLWHSYFGTSHATMERAKKRFFMDTSLLFRDLGNPLDENIMDINRLLIQLVSTILLKGQK
jgi:hypothetical protein